MKQLVAFSLLWTFVPFLAPVPALGNFDSGDCTVGDSPGKIVHEHYKYSIRWEDGPTNFFYGVW